MREPPVADTSVLQYLHQLGRLEWLRELFGAVLVPLAVADELAAGRAQGVDLPALEAHPWIEVRAAPAAPRRLPAGRLGRGETAVLALASQTAAVAILDDHDARSAAVGLGLEVTGTLGILLLAKDAGLLHAVAPELKRLLETGFRVDDALCRRILRLAGERGP